MKKNNKKGFTLAELLIVVAIIAVLVAIAIPVFNAQLDKSKLATGTANARSAVAEYTATQLQDGNTPTLDGALAACNALSSDLKKECTYAKSGTAGIEVTGPGSSGTALIPFGLTTGSGS